MSSILNRIAGLFDFSSGQDLLSIPEELSRDIRNNLQDNELLEFSMRALSARYKAARLIDSNTFFNPFLILTTSRLLIAKNSSNLNIFRDINLISIIDTRFEISDNSSSLNLKQYNSSDIIYFPRNCREQVELFRKSFERVMNDISHLSKEVIFCRYCGEKIPSDSNFCQDCGNKL